ncbi:hypothetical protein J0S82_014583 [Galemys pyrenaicus]|uniref:Uncharacterized protein n=1 Tax=Galemys pyrenaicus TaxID=202257 RepID=A0A8J6AP72_GALPY|nr:hypothetical protein J0S82_014583 [Galemys pyrenaicus]
MRLLPCVLGQVPSSRRSGCTTCHAFWNPQPNAAFGGFNFTVLAISQSSSQTPVQRKLSQLQEALMASGTSGAGEKGPSP